MMRKSLSLLMIIFGLIQTGSVQAMDELTLSRPPASLEQWYKPANKRQVWLHTMFALRRAMQAVSEYTALEDQVRLNKWATRLVEDYRKIGEMVPEWQDELELEWADKLLSAAAAMDAPGVQQAQRKLGQSCGACHREYRAITAVVYRVPDYSQIIVEDSETLEERPYDKAMEGISYSLNRVKIALDDGRPEIAAEAQEQLATRLSDLGEGCTACHKGDEQRAWILGQGMQHQLTELAAAIGENRNQDAMKKLGGLAVEVCARCHSIHRSAADLRAMILAD